MSLRSHLHQMINAQPGFTLVASWERYRAPDTDGRGLRTRGSRQSISLLSWILASQILAVSVSLLPSHSCFSLLSFNCISLMVLMGELV